MIEIPSTIIMESLNALRLDWYEVFPAIAIEIDEIAGGIDSRNSDASFVCNFYELGAILAEQFSGFWFTVGNIEF